MTCKEQAPGGPNERVSEDNEHPLAIGLTVDIVNLNAGNRTVIEGCAVIRHIACGRHRYWVAFIGDPVLREREVYPEHGRDHSPVSLDITDGRIPNRGDHETFTDFFPPVEAQGK